MMFYGEVYIHLCSDTKYRLAIGLDVLGFAGGGSGGEQVVVRSPYSSLLNRSNSYSTESEWNCSTRGECGEANIS